MLKGYMFGHSPSSWYLVEAIPSLSLLSRMGYPALVAQVGIVHLFMQERGQIETEWMEEGWAGAAPHPPLRFITNFRMLFTLHRNK